MKSNRNLKFCRTLLSPEKVVKVKYDHIKKFQNSLNTLDTIVT